MVLKPYEIKLIGKLLEMASDKFGNHSCNDFDLVEDGGLTVEQAKELNHKLALADDDDPDLYDHVGEEFGDAYLMGYYAQQFRRSVSGGVLRQKTSFQMAEVE